MILKGQIFLADFSCGVGSEQVGLRPCIIVSNNIGNKFSPCVIVALITSKTDKPILPTHVEILQGEGGLSKKSLILCEQVRTIDKLRLKKNIGLLPRKNLQDLDTALRASFGI